jgi:hypothetical protein
MPHTLGRPRTGTTSWVVEHYWPGLTSELFRTLTRRLRRTAAAMARDGMAVRCRHSTLVPADEAAYSVIEAASQALVQAAHAKTFCFNSTSPPSPTFDNPHVMVVAKNFSVPKKGKCTPIVGYDLAGANGSRPPTKTACLNSDGTRLRAGFTLHPYFSGDGFVAWHMGMDLPYPSLRGGTVVMHNDFVVGL